MNTNTLQDFLDRQPPLSRGVQADAAAIAVRMQNALHQSLGGLPVADLPNIKVEVDKLTVPETTALETAFESFVDFHRDLIVDGVIS